MPAFRFGGLFRTIFGQAVVVVLTGVFIGLAANAVSPRGLVLGRDYFSQLAPVGHDVHRAQIRSKGYRPVSLEEAAALFRGPDFARELVVFVDVRRDDLYQQGHVPGAWQLDRFRPELQLGTVLPVCRTARKVVVYCGGGACEDSLYGADLLADSGIPKDRLLVMPGGISEWEAGGFPVETGPRRSGNLKPASAP